MKTLLITLLLLISTAYAKEKCGETKTSTHLEKTELDTVTEVPNHLRGATITLKKADGSQEVLKAEDYMIVKRQHKRPVFREKIATTRIQCQDETVKNIVSLKAVNSYGRADLESDDTSATISTSKRRTLGGQYQRNVGKNIFLGVDADLNRNAGLLIGLGF